MAAIALNAAPMSDGSSRAGKSHIMPHGHQSDRAAHDEKKF
jgi:hypothetical protein